MLFSVWDLVGVIFILRFAGSAGVSPADLTSICQPASENKRKGVAMMASAISGALAVLIVGLAVIKWQILQDRHAIVSTIGIALKDRKAVLAGAFLGIFYLAVFMILGGKGGRVHILFGRLIWNTTPGEVLTGLILAALVMLSVTLIAHSVHANCMARSGTKGRIGIAGTFLALLACFCP
jgi:hypothetical protein